MANSMTAADLCSMYKPWKLQVQLVDVIMEEFWQQVKSRASPEKTAFFFVRKDNRNRIQYFTEYFLHLKVKV